MCYIVVEIWQAPSTLFEISQAAYIQAYNQRVYSARAWGKPENALLPIFEPIHTYEVPIFWVVYLGLVMNMQIAAAQCL